MKARSNYSAVPGEKIAGEPEAQPMTVYLCERSEDYGGTAVVEIHSTQETAMQWLAAERDRELAEQTERRASYVEHCRINGWPMDDRWLADVGEIRPTNPEHPEEGAYFRSRDMEWSIDWWVVLP